MKILPSGGLKFGRFERLKWFPVECNEAKSSHEVSDEHSKIFSEKKNYGFWKLLVSAQNYGS